MGARADAAGRAELRSATREREEAHMKARRYPLLHLETKGGKLRPSVEKALQHKEVDAMIDEVTKEHAAEQASGDPLAPLKRAQKEFAEETAKDDAMAAKWKALKYGSKRLIPRTDEANVLAEAHKITAQQEAELPPPHRITEEEDPRGHSRVREEQDGHRLGEET